jgi:hypothetical protein
MIEDMIDNDVRRDLEGWLPANAVVHILARRNPEFGHWETLFPEFSIAGQGATFELAIDNAMELLHDYLWLCKAEGKTYAESRRGASWRTAVATIADAIKLVLRSRRRDRINTHRPLRLA